MHRRHTIKMYQIFKVCTQLARSESHPRFFLPLHKKKLCVCVCCTRSLSLCILYWFHLCPTFFFRRRARDCLAIVRQQHKVLPLFFFFLSAIHTARTRLYFSCATFPRIKCTGHGLAMHLHRASCIAHIKSGWRTRTHRLMRFVCNSSLWRTRKTKEENEYMDAYWVHFILLMLYIFARVKSERRRNESDDGWIHCTCMSGNVSTFVFGWRRTMLL